MKIIIGFIKPYWKLCAATLLLVVADVAGALLIPTITARMINLGVGGSDLSLIVNTGMIMLVISIIAGIASVFGSWLSAKLSAKIGRDMRNAVYDKSLTFSTSDFEKFGTGSMITRTLNDVNVIQQGIVMCLGMIIPVPIMCVMGIVLSFHINRDIGFLILGVMVFVMLVAAFIVKRTASIFDKLQRFFDRMNVVLRENITGVRVIRAFCKERYEQGRMGKSFVDYAKTAIYANRMFTALDSLSMLAINLCIVVILWIGGNHVAGRAMKIGDITAVTEYAVLILYYIVMAQMVITLIPRAVTCLRRISEVLNHTPEIEDGKEGRLLMQKKDESQVIRFDDVSFHFPGADENTLQGLSFVCRRGETTAIIGGTGSGKSTIAKLILRYHDVSCGRVLLNGCDIRRVTQHTLREHISYVPQKAWLFSGIIEDNLRHGNPKASREELRRALDVAQAGFVDTLPDGINSDVAQGGTNFSGGQKQRLSIARALVKKADLYIFDDSFSALDFKTDAALRSALAGELQNAAVLIIAQRISTIVNADQIIVIDDGKIAGIGTHSYLMENCPVYVDTAKSQMKGGGFNGK